MGFNDILLLAGAGLAAFFLFTDEGKSMISDIVEETPAIQLGTPGYDDEEVQRWIDEESEIYFPIQDLHIPKGWPNYYPYYDPYRQPSAEWKDWYIKGAYGYPKDQLYPKHYNWNPDYYFYFGNMYKKWYPSAMAPDDWPSRERIYSPIPQTAWDFPFFPPH